VAAACECGNERSGFVTCGKFLDWLQTSQLLKQLTGLPIRITVKVNELAGPDAVYALFIRLLPRMIFFVQCVPFIVFPNTAAVSASVQTHRDSFHAQGTHATSRDLPHFFCNIYVSSDTSERRGSRLPSRVVLSIFIATSHERSKQLY
jgi:hypothetical protein